MKKEEKYFIMRCFFWVPLPPSPSFLPPPLPLPSLPQCLTESFPLITDGTVFTGSAFSPALSQRMVGSGEPVAKQLIANGVVHSVTSMLLWSWRTEGGTVCVCVLV